MLTVENGFITGESPPISGKKLYIMGLENLETAREIQISLQSLAYVQGAIVNWGGDLPPEFPLNWKLTAGFDHPAVKDRRALFDQIKLAHAMGASAGVSNASGNGQDVLKGPPKIRLVIPGHISCVGVIKSVRTTENGPWDLMSGSNLPTSCTFSLTVIPIKSYDPERIVAQGTETWLAQDVLGSFYQS